MRDDFSGFFAEAEPQLRRALTACYGPERGSEATAEALAYAWEHWPRVSGMERPIGYLFRVGQTRSRRLGRRPVAQFPEVPSSTLPWVEPRLPRALAGLTKRQRVAVVLVCGFEWQLRDVAELLGLKVTTVQNHVERGLAKLRTA